MKKLLAPLVIAAIVFSSCMKNDNKCGFNDNNIIVPDAEMLALEDSLAAHNITAIKHPSGFYYSISNPGTGQSVVNLCSNIFVNYKGKFFNGVIFDSTQAGITANFQLGGVIEGWRKGIPLVKGGGDINLYIPPSLAYGATERNGLVPIPKNSYMVFEIHIESIQ